MKNPLISVIVPVYKVEQYLATCLNSIVNQTYKNLEIILVDDGSPDNCGKICDEYAQKDDRIVVLHQPNSGVSRARNAGLDIAKGEYIAFVDSDDYIALDMYEELMSIAQKQSADIVTCNHYTINNKGTVLCTNNFDNLNVDEVRYLILMDKYSICLWDKLYKASLFNDIRFKIDIYSEDLFIMPSLFFKAEKLAWTSQAYYYYCLNMGSNMTLFGTKRKYGFFAAWEEHEKFAKKYCPKAYTWSEFRTIRNAIGALVANMKEQILTQQKIKKCENYLAIKKAVGVSAKIGIKYKILWWSLNHCLIICKIYGQINFMLKKLKKR
jgi:glycosyltransferase involved in cell wall biosynthesis